MRGWPVMLALLFVVPAAAGSPWGAGSGPLAVTLRITEGGSPVQGSIGASHVGADGPEFFEATLDATGTGTLHLWPGQTEVSLRGPNPEQRVRGYGTLAFDHDVTLSLDLASRAATVPVNLTVVDGETGVALSNADILPQMLFGDYLCIGTRPTTMTPSVSGSPPQSQPPPQPCDLQWSGAGHLVGKVPPGVLGLRASVLDHSTCLVGFEQADRTPCRMYAPTYRTFQAADGQTLQATIALPVLPAPDAGLEGYLISNITGKAIASKSIQFRGSGVYSNVGFSAYLDRDGSYRLRIPAGNYTATSYVCGHDSVTVPFTAVSGQTLRLDLVLEAYGHSPAPLPPGAGTSYTAGAGTSYTTSASASGSPNGGPPAYPSCDSQTPTVTQGPGGGEEPTTESAPPAEPQPAMAQDVGGIAVADFGGGLGPLGGVQYSDQTDSTGSAHEDTTGGLSSAAKDRFSPSVTVVASLALVALAAFALRRRLA